MNYGKFQFEQIYLSESSVTSFGFATVNKAVVLKMQMNSGRSQDEQLDQIESGALEFKFAKTIKVVTIHAIGEVPSLGVVMLNECVDGIIAARVVKRIFCSTIFSPHIICNKQLHTVLPKPFVRRNILI